ncbi:PBP1A family penicillin-binding protein [Aciduricibacillus chroicocephali]|uniref:PBP1A family penicillin-binding protein n=1 Tax=Aciduricibacillus chroicocephali TaxID=3054939 RepID=A0ABY9KTL3_9BACI|nr:PBP1A family penicillin-binding protein [Bacillaceae bacterium 44XB]
MRTSRRMQRRKRRRILKWFILICIMLPVMVIGGMYAASYIAGPPPIGSVEKTVYYSKDDERIDKTSGNSQNYVPLSEITPSLVNATIAIEDRNFYNHHGFDFKRIGGSILADIRTLSLKEGASTLTQQYARNLYLSHEKTWTRKAKEAYYTTRLEMYYSKQEILEGYLNRVYYGHGAYGVEAASRYYFNKHASDLTIAESAMLAGIPKGPTYYSPFNDKERATARQQLILKVMQKEQYITSAEYEQAVSEQLVYNEPGERSKDEVGPYFQDMVDREAAKLLDKDIESLRSGGYKIYTTLDVSMQEKLDEQIEKDMKPETKMEVGAIAMDPHTGELRAIAGGRDYEKSTYNRAVSAVRMPGSTFKPLLYYAALEKGYTASTPLMSSPTSFELEDGKVYEPNNYNGYYANKPITMAQALALSDNIYAVKTNMFLKPETLVRTARIFGIKSKLAPVPSLALGSYEVSVKEMVSAYSMIANGGQKVDLHTVRKIEDASGDTLYENDTKTGQQVLDRSKAFILTHLMTGIFDEKLNGYMQVTGASISKQLTREYAGKTGSTDSDSWMIGYSPELAVGVWTGYDDNKKIENADEMGYAKNIWAGFMEQAHDPERKLPFLVPAGVVPVKVDPETGLRATPYCNNSRVMYFEKKSAPKETCTIHMHGEDLAKDWFESEDKPPIDPNLEKKKQKEEKKRRKEMVDKWKAIIE